VLDFPPAAETLRLVRVNRPLSQSCLSDAATVMATDKIQIGSEARVSEIGRTGTVQESPRAFGRPPIRERLRAQLSTLRKFASSLVAISLWTRVLYIVLAALSGAVWALSLARFFFSTGWPALFHLAYATGSGGSRSSVLWPPLIRRAWSGSTDTWTAGFAQIEIELSEHGR
jgi:hypothetical protein